MKLACVLLGFACLRDPAMETPFNPPSWPWPGEWAVEYNGQTSAPAPFGEAIKIFIPACQPFKVVGYVSGENWFMFRTQREAGTDDIMILTLGDPNKESLVPPVKPCSAPVS
jgi:hypothetical protein